MGTKCNYIIVKYPPSSLYKLEVKVSDSDFYEIVKKENKADFLWGLVGFIYIGIPSICLTIIIIIIVCCCMCLRKKKNTRNG